MHSDIFLDNYISQIDFWHSFEMLYFGFLLNLKADKTLLDIGCNLGDLSHKLLQ